MIKRQYKKCALLVGVMVLLIPVIELSATQTTINSVVQQSAQETSILTAYINEELTAKVITLALLTAFLLGAVHALSPGHGKVMVASYLIGSRGKITNAITLGGIVTATHIVSVVILGVCSLVLAEYFVEERLYGWLGLFSGALIFLIGYWMVAKPALTLTKIRNHRHTHSHHSSEHSHSHGHSHSHSHHHSLNSEEQITLKSLLALGTAGGMVPCPTAMVVLLASIAIHKIFFGLLLIVFFSLGLAVVLILVGIMTVKASKYIELFSEDKKLIQRLPVFSAGIIMLIGISISFNSLLSAGIISLTNMPGGLNEG